MWTLTSDGGKRRYDRHLEGDAIGSVHEQVVDADCPKEGAIEVGFVGLGNMGLPMARNLLRAGHQVRVWNRTPAPVEPLAQEGAERAASPAEAARVGILTMLADDAATLAVVEGPNGILAGLPAGGIHVAASTLGAPFSRRLTELHRERGQQYVAAPVFGRPAVAEQGGLRVIVAGPGEAVERLRPLFDALAHQVFVLGEAPHLAHAAKLAGNFVMTSIMEALCESLVLVQKTGIEREHFAEVLNAIFRSPLVESYCRLLLERRFDQPSFRFRLGLKDIRLVLEVADETTTPLPLADLIRQHALEGLARGMDELDFTALLRIVEAHAGLDGSTEAA